MTSSKTAPQRPGRADPTPRLRATADLYAALTRRLTPRDRLILRTLQEHRVLTTGQIQQLCFGTYSAAAQRLRTLHHLRAVDRFRPFTTTGSAPCHYVLDELGAWTLAAETGRTAADIGYRRERALAIAHSAKLVHTVGVNGFFTALTATTRRRKDCELLAWWSETRCAREWGDICCPDGYGRWQQGDRQCDFFLEHDTGTEPLPRLAAKLTAYAELGTITGITTPVLFALPTRRRETNLHQRITHPPVPALTAVISDGAGPAETAWRPIGSHDPVPLIDIGATETTK